LRARVSNFAVRTVGHGAGATRPSRRWDVDAGVARLDELSDGLGGATVGERVNTPTIELASGVPAIAARLIEKSAHAVNRALA
jgi:hypothetical protein